VVGIAVKYRVVKALHLKSLKDLHIPSKRNNPQTNGKIEQFWVKIYIGKRHNYNYHYEYTNIYIVNNDNIIYYNIQP